MKKRDLRVIGAALLAVALLGGACNSEEEPAAEEAAKETLGFCPLSGRDVPDGVDVERPAVAVKVENNSVAYPLSGLEDAEIVYEELVEGGLTRFMALYHCTDSKKVGPIRSARFVDPDIMKPLTSILAAAGGNGIVMKELAKEKIVDIGEGQGRSMRRVERPGISSEHTLYGSTELLRKIGAKKYDKRPPEDVFRFGPTEEKGKKAKEVTINFSGATTVTYKWNGKKWERFDDGEPLKAENGNQIAVDNVIVEVHKVMYSKEIVDVLGNPSIEIDDVQGAGRAVLFRDGVAIEGRWERKTDDDPVSFVTKKGDPLVLAQGTTWIELVPDNRGEVKGSFKYK